MEKNLVKSSLINSFMACPLGPPAFISDAEYVPTSRASCCQYWNTIVKIKSSSIIHDTSLPTYPSTIWWGFSKPGLMAKLKMKLLIENSFLCKQHHRDILFLFYQISLLFLDNKFCPHCLDYLRCCMVWWRRNYHHLHCTE